MKLRTTLLALSLVTALSACKGAAPPPEAAAPPPAAAAVAPPPPMPAGADAEQLINDYVAAWNAHDAEKAASYFDEDGVYFDASVGDPQRGRQAALDNVIKVFLGAVPDCHWEMRSLPIVTPDGVAFEWTYSGTNTGDWSPTTKATGKPIKFNGVSFVRIKNGKIVYQGDYYDAATLNKQLGW